MVIYKSRYTLFFLLLLIILPKLIMGQINNSESGRAFFNKGYDSIIDSYLKNDVGGNDCVFFATPYVANLIFKKVDSFEIIKITNIDWNADWKFDTQIIKAPLDNVELTAVFEEFESFEPNSEKNIIQDGFGVNIYIRFISKQNKSYIKYSGILFYYPEDYPFSNNFPVNFMKVLKNM